jgi:hypothetical protein
MTNAALEDKKETLARASYSPLFAANRVNQSAFLSTAL